MEMGLFEIKESSHINGDGVNIVTKTSKVTGKGQQYFINKFLAKKDAGTKEAQGGCITTRRRKSSWTTSVRR